jgi:hexosaminidase
MSYAMLLYFICTLLLVGQSIAIWPAPISLSSGSSALWLAEDVTVTYNGGNVCWISYTHTRVSMSETEQVLRAQCPTTNGSSTNLSSISSESVVQSAVQRAYKTIFTENFVPWKLYPRNSISDFEPSANETKTFITVLEITQTKSDNASTFKPLAGQVDESYNLTLKEDGSASIVASSSTGILRALDTFTQLFYQHSQPGQGVYTPLAPLEIYDAPKFSHRGLNMDVSRNWFPKQNILRTIDALAWNKFNRLHLHVTDAQSWPIDIPSIPELSLKGAYQVGLSYTPADIEEIQTYATYRGVEVIIEMDMPGHTTSIGLAFPELITAFEAHPWTTYCAEPPCGSLKLNSTAVYEFLEKLFDDILPRVSPHSAYFHTGGDEVNAQAYLLDETVQSNLTTVLIPLLQKFVDRNHEQVRAAGLAPVVWEEMLLDWNLTLGSDVVVQTWISEDSLAQVVNRGHKAIFGNYNYWVCHLS